MPSIEQNVLSEAKSHTILHGSMSADSGQLSLIVGSTGFWFVFVLSLHALQRLGSWVLRFVTADDRSLAHGYEDQDGDATDESVRNASKQSLQLAILPIVSLGTVISALETGLTAHQSVHSAGFVRWTDIGTWACLLLQCLALCVCPSPATCFSIAWRAGLSGVAVLLVLLVQSYSASLPGEVDTTLAVLIGMKAVIGSTASVLCFLIPRRPDVFYKGTVVDRQFTTSLLGWISFSWIDTVLRKSQCSGHLTIDDLPELDHTTRGEALYDIWKTKLARHNSASAWGLWWTIFRSHRSAFGWQVIVIVLLSVFSFVPQLSLLRILTLMEARQLGENAGSLWVPVLGLGLSLIASAALDTIKYWISYNKLAVRVQQQLSLVIFDKAVRLSRTSTPDKSGDDEPSQNGQSPVNMVAVDVKNVADFLCFFFLIYESPLKLGLASVFLVYLLGWRSLVAGFAVLGLLTLSNTFAGWNYSRWQGALMEFRDHKQQLLVEMLRGIRQIKFSAQETRWGDQVNRLRDTEMRAQWTVCRWQIVFVSLYSVCPVLLSAACLSVHVMLSGGLSASTAFTSISVLASIEVAMTILPDVISFFLNARVSMQRIQAYLSQPEHNNQVILSSHIVFQDATVSWSGCRGSPGSLKGLNLNFPREALSIVTGPTGSGKSLLLASILGETHVLDGTISAPASAPFEKIPYIPVSEPWLTDSAVAFVPQSPWLQNTTLKENILFGLPLDEQRYAEVVFACALKEDIANLPNKDLTEICSKGANLSGGQRWRTCLARALYSRARTLLMDDIFSALDVHTKDHIYQHVLCGELLHGRTCILVTHHLDLCLPRAKYLVRLRHGALESATALCDTQPDAALGLASVAHPHETDPSSVGSRLSSSASRSFRQEKEKEAHAQPPSSIGSTVLSVFLKEGGNIFQWLVLGVAFLAYGTSMLARSWWIHIWTDDYQNSGQPTTSPGNQKEQPATQHPVVYYVAIYLALSASACVFGTCRTYFSLSAALKASKRLFRKMLCAVLQAPLQWHDTVPLGSILGRFSADFNVIDVRVGDDLRATLEYTMDVAMAVIAGTIANPFLLIVSALLFSIYMWYARRFIAASRQLKTLENTAKGPLLEHIDSILSGLSTVRAFGQVDLAALEFQDAVGRHARAFWHLWLLNRWLGFRVNIIGAVFSAASAAMMAYLSNVSPSMAGFAISFTIDVSLTMALSVRRYVNLEQGMNSMGRIHQYTVLPREDDNSVDSSKPQHKLPDSWPCQGRLEVSRLVIRHAPHLPPVLHDVSFTIAPNTRVGVVGRTGAGKSSLVLALFRFLEASHGTILIDGIDISRVPLQQLRSRLAIIPQHPVLFRGNIRSNLDPFGEYDDPPLLAALQAVGWQQEERPMRPNWETQHHAVGDSVDNSSSSATANEFLEADHDQINPDEYPRVRNHTLWDRPLDQPVLDCGENLSHGQQQLLCLARAIIRKPKIMILDEATSAVDKPTDDRIQRSLRSALSQCEATLLVIAHRLKTIVDSDMLLVIDGGRVVESGSPQELLRRENGCFRGMVEHDSERELLEGLIFGGRLCETTTT